MLIDLHAHSSGISACCRQPAEKILDTAKEIGLDGIVLTNHYYIGYLRGSAPQDFARRYYEEFLLAEAYGKQIGLKVFFGIEVTMEAHGGIHMLLYGAEEAFLKEYPDLWRYEQKQLYQMIHAWGGAMVQAHPFRGNRRVLLDPQYLDGVEINCHPGYRDGTHIDELTQIATEHGLILTCGGDYHADCRRAHCGTYLPDSITDTKALAAYLTSTPEISFQMQEVTGEEPRTIHFRRSR